LKLGSVVIAHLIGTVSMLVLFSVIATSFAIHYSVLQLEILACDLQDVSQHVSGEIVDLVSLCYLSTGDQLIFKELDIPKNINLEAYNVSIVSSQGLLKVVAQSIVRLSLYGESLLPWSADGNIGFYNGTDPGINDPRITPKVSVSSISENLIVWCLKKEDRITFGLGLKGG